MSIPEEVCKSGLRIRLDLQVSVGQFRSLVSIDDEAASCIRVTLRYFVLLT